MKAKPNKTGEIKLVLEDIENAIMVVKRINDKYLGKKPIGSERYLTGKRL